MAMHRHRILLLSFASLAVGLVAGCGAFAPTGLRGGDAPTLGTENDGATPGPSADTGGTNPGDGNDAADANGSTATPLNSNALPPLGQDANASSALEPNGVAAVGGSGAGSNTGTGSTTGAVTAPPLAKEPFFGFGAIIDYDGLGPHGKQSVQSFVSATKVVPTVVDSYVQLKADGTFELGTAKLLIDQAAQANVPTVCLSITCHVQGKLPDSQLQGLVEAVKYARSKGINTEIRFGYEMNGYWSPSNVTGKTANSPSNFLLQWAQLAPVMQAAGGRMFWSPNIPFDANSALARWQPADPKTIDMVGLDYYPKDRELTTATVIRAMDMIYPTAQKLNKPVYFGESAWQLTGSTIVENSSEAQKKVAWLKALSDATVRQKYPLYRGFRWFDYQKYENATYNNFSISADPYAAAAFTAWYTSSVFAGQK